MTAIHNLDLGRLATYLRRLYPELRDDEVALVPVGGHGQSNPSYFVTAGAHRLVLRKKPPGELLPSAHAVDREYRVLKALHGSALPVPRPIAYCDDAGVVGTPFYLMQRLDGRIFSDAALPGSDAAERGAVYLDMARTLATLHALDWQALGLEGFGRTEGYYARQLARWGRQWGDLRSAAANPELDALLAWLPERMPRSERARVAHGDFKLNNLMYDAARSEVVAVLDWELSTLGDPLADLAFCCTLWRLQRAEFGGIRDLPLADLGIPSEAEFVAHYARCGGEVDGLAPFHHAFAFMRLAVIFEGIAWRARQGNAVAANAAEVGALATVLAARGLEATCGGTER